MKRSVHLSLCGLLIVLMVSSHAIADDELAYVKQTIAAKGAKWETGETSVSKLSKEERKMKLGLDKSKMPDAPMAALPGDVTGLSPTLDWRSYNSLSWVTPVRNQGQCGSC